MAKVNTGKTRTRMEANGVSCWMPSAVQHQRRGRWMLDAGTALDTGQGAGQGDLCHQEDQCSHAGHAASQYSDCSQGLLSDLQLEPMVPLKRTREMPALHGGVAVSAGPLCAHGTHSSYPVSLLPLGDDLIG